MGSVISISLTSEHPLHEELDFDSYSVKLSKFAYFILAYQEDKCIGFVAYYLNKEGNFVYIPQVVVHKDYRHQGVGHSMFNALYKKYIHEYNTIKLEVLKDNTYARAFYLREHFIQTEDNEERLLLTHNL